MLGGGVSGFIGRFTFCRFTFGGGTKFFFILSFGGGFLSNSFLFSFPSWFTFWCTFWFTFWFTFFLSVAFCCSDSGGCLCCGVLCGVVFLADFLGFVSSPSSLVWFKVSFFALCASSGSLSLFILCMLSLRSLSSFSFVGLLCGFESCSIAVNACSAWVQQSLQLFSPG